MLAVLLSVRMTVPAPVLPVMPAASFTPTLAPTASALPALSLPPLVAASPIAPAIAAPAVAAPAAVLSAAAVAPAASAAAFDGGKPLSVLVAAAESYPLIKTGGLADVVDAVARGLAERGHEVSLVLPKYRQLKTAGLDLADAGEVSVPMGGRVEKARLWTARKDGVKIVLIEHAGYYGRDGGPYDGRSVYGHDDNDERFAFYARATLEASKALGLRPDIVHAHDWHAALIPAFLKLAYASDPFFTATKVALTIHNIAYQGVYGRDSALTVGLPAERFDDGTLEQGGAFNHLKTGVVLADAVTTVSPTYAREIRESSAGMGLESLLAGRGVTGILNGLDLPLWDPRTDATIARAYAPHEVEEGKAANKAAFQRLLGLEEKPDAPLFSIASRLAHQKGVDLVLASAEEVLARGGQLAIMGSGDKELEDGVAALARRFPGRVAAHPFHDTLVRLLFAASDFLLMPSRFEPCGLSQLIAQRYGTLPLVTRVGGLADTVRDLRVDLGGDGLFVDGFTPAALAASIAAAVDGYRNPRALAVARRTAMTKDSSWDASFAAYEALFRALVQSSSSAAARDGSKTP